MARQRRLSGEAAPPKKAVEAIDARINEKLPADPNERGGKTEIKVPKRRSLVKPKRDEFPVPVPNADATEGVCSGCGKIRALRNGKVISHSWPLPTRQLCPGSGKGPRVRVEKDAP